MRLFRRRHAPRPIAEPGAPPDTAPPDAAPRGAGQADAGQAGAPILHIDGQNFFTETAQGFTVVDCWADWCGPCHQYAPVFEELATEYAGRVRFGKLDVDASPDISGMLQIRSIPTTIVFDPDGNEAARIVGIPPRRQFTKLLDELAAAPRR